MQKKIFFWMIAAILVCDASVFTSCTIDNADNPVKPLGIAIDETNFPDAAFRQCLFDYYKFAKDGILTDEEIKNTTTLEVDWEDIKNLKGIEYFTALEELDCCGNDLTELDVSTIQALEMIQCYNNKISGQNMDNLIGSLPLNDTPTYFDFAVINYSMGVEKEGNVCTKSQVEALKAKGWLPQQWDDDEEEWVEYPGSDN